MLKTTQKAFVFILITMLQIACTIGSDNEVVEPEIANELKISFEINNTPISITYPNTQNSGVGIATSKVHDSDNLLLTRVSETYFNDDYEIKLYFSDYFSSNDYDFDYNEKNILKLPWEEFKDAMFNNDALGMSYINYQGSNNTYLPLKSYKGVTIEIKDVKNNKTYTSKLLEKFYTEDANNPYEYTNFMANSYFEFVSAESLLDDSSGFSKNYKVEANFECKLLDYTKQADGEIIANDVVYLTNGKITGVL